jgi:hypothetical protein
MLIDAWRDGEDAAGACGHTKESRNRLARHARLAWRADDPDLAEDLDGAREPVSSPPRTLAASDHERPTSEERRTEDPDLLTHPVNSSRYR